MALIGLEFIMAVPRHAVWGGEVERVPVLGVHVVLSSGSVCCYFLRLGGNERNSDAQSSRDKLIK